IAGTLLIIGFLLVLSSIIVNLLQPNENEKDADTEDAFSKNNSFLKRTLWCIIDCFDLTQLLTYSTLSCTHLVIIMWPKEAFRSHPSDYCNHNALNKLLRDTKYDRFPEKIIGVFHTNLDLQWHIALREFQGVVF